MSSAQTTVNGAISSFNSTANALGADFAVFNSSNNPPSGTSRQTDVDLYNQAVATLQSQLNAYNSALGSYANAVTAYNNATTTYNAINTEITARNTLVAKLTPPLAPLPLLPTATTVSASAGVLPAAPSTISFSLSPLSNPTFSTYNSTATAPPTLSLLGAAPSFTVPSLTQYISSFFSPTFAALLYTLTSQNTTLNSLDTLRNKRWFDPNALVHDVNSDSPTKPDASLNVPQSTDTGGGVSSATTVAGLDNPHLINILNKAGITKAFQQFTPQNADEVVSTILLISAGLLISSSLQAIPGTLGALGSHLSKLKPSSPALSIVTALSVLNRNLELANSTALTTTIQNLIAKNPTTASLSPTDQAALASQISASISLSLILLSAKTLSETLGLPGLPAQLLASIPGLSPSTLQTIFSNASVSAGQEQATLLANLKQGFVAQGFNATQSAFLASVAATTVRNQYIQPSATTASYQTINYNTVVSSLAAQLLLNNSLFTVDQAKLQAANIVKNALANTDNVKTDTFRIEISNLLIQSGITTNKAENIANNILILPNEATLSQLPPLTGISTPIIPLTQVEITQQIKQRVLDLLTPEVGATQATYIASEIIKSLFYQPVPVATSTTVQQTDAKQPYSFVQVAKQQISEDKSTKAQAKKRSPEPGVRGLHCASCRSLSTITQSHGPSLFLPGDHQHHVK